MPKFFLHLVRNFTWLVDHVLSVVVGQLDARLDDGPAEPGRLDFSGLLHDPLHREGQTVDTRVEGAEVFAQDPDGKISQ